MTVKVPKRQHVDENKIRKIYPYLKSVLEHAHSHPIEAKILVYLWKPSSFKEIERDVEPNNPARYLNKLIKLNYIKKGEIFGKSAIYYLTELGITLARGHLGFVKMILESRQFAQEVHLDRTYLILCKKLLENIPNQKQEDPTLRVNSMRLNP